MDKWSKIMGEIIFSIFIGSCLIFIGVLLNTKLYKEENNLCKKNNKKSIVS